MNKQDLTLKIQTAVKDGDKETAQYLKNILGEVERAENDFKNPVVATPESIEATIKGVVKNLKVSLNAAYGKAEYVTQAEAMAKELAFLKTFLPKELSEDEVKALIKDIIARTGAKEARGIMPHLKGIEGIDMKAASALIPSCL